MKREDVMDEDSTLSEEKKELTMDIAMGRFFGEILNTADDGSVFSDGPIYTEGSISPEYEDTFNKHYEQAESDLDEFVEFVISDHVEEIETYLDSELFDKELEQVVEKASTEFIANRIKNSLGVIKKEENND